MSTPITPKKSIIGEGIALGYDSTYDEYGVLRYFRNTSGNIIYKGYGVSVDTSNSINYFTLYSSSLSFLGIVADEFINSGEYGWIWVSGTCIVYTDTGTYPNDYMQPKDGSGIIQPGASWGPGCIGRALDQDSNSYLHLLLLNIGN